MSNWRIFTKILEKKKDAFFAKDEPVIDNNLPLGFRIGALVTLDQSDFTLFRDQLMFSSPGVEHTVVGWSKFDLHGYTHHRFYLKGKENNEESIIEVVMDKGQVAEVRLFRDFDQIFPSSHADWEDWLGENGFIGDGYFQIIDEDNETGDELVTEYKNQWSEGRSTPATFLEEVHLDKYGETSVSQRSTLCLYGRDLIEGDDNAKEYLYISEEENSGEAYVRMLMGKPIGEADLKIV